MILGSIYSEKLSPKLVKSCAESGEKFHFFWHQGDRFFSCQMRGGPDLQASGAWAGTASGEWSSWTFWRRHVEAAAEGLADLTELMGRWRRAIDGG